MAAGFAGPIFGIPVDEDRWVIPQTLLLNNCPHSPFARTFFYNAVSCCSLRAELQLRPDRLSLRQVVRAVDQAIEDPGCPRRMRVSCLIPETNPTFDTYRIGGSRDMFPLPCEVAVCCDVLDSVQARCSRWFGLSSSARL
jgi:hypothetical protein